MDKNNNNNKVENNGGSGSDRGGEKHFHKHYRGNRRNQHYNNGNRRGDNAREGQSEQNLKAEERLPKGETAIAGNTERTEHTDNTKRTENTEHTEHKSGNQSHSRFKNNYRSSNRRHNQNIKNPDGAEAENASVPSGGEADVHETNPAENGGKENRGSSGRGDRRYPSRRNGGYRRDRSRDKNIISNELSEMESDNAEEITETVKEEIVQVINGDTETSEYTLSAGYEYDPEEEIVSEINSVSIEEAQAAVESDEPREWHAPATFEIIGVRFKTGGKVYYFDPAGMAFKKGEPVIVDTARGLEYGICEIPNRIVTEKEVVLPLRRAVRAATEDDIEKAAENRQRAEEAMAICAEKISEHKLGMKLVDVEYTFDNSKLLFYFTADGRVDFRDLVKDLASVFRTRIELRQIGIRDETKLLGGIGICGRPFCCKSFLSDFVQVSIKMAKEQNLSLNSAKISGACGRLMCCLRYEYDTYQEEIKKTPKVGQSVSTPDGEGTVTEIQPLAGMVRVKFPDKDAIPKVYHRDDITVMSGEKKRTSCKNTDNKSE